MKFQTPMRRNVVAELDDLSIAHNPILWSNQPNETSYVSK